MQRKARALVSVFNAAGTEPKVTLLYRFHLTVIVVNLIAIGIDVFMARTFNIFIETAMTVLLTLNLFWLYRRGMSSLAVYVFLGVLSAGLLLLIYINHFATMSVVFVLLLPLLTMLFIRLKYSLVVTAMLFIIMAALLYLESRANPENPLVQNPQALFNLGYAALIIFVFGLLYHISILRTFDELDDSNRQKEMLLKEVHHRVKNNLNVIASIIGLQANTLHPEDKEHLLKSKIRIESIAMVHEMLYTSDDFASIDFKTYMQRLSGLLLSMYGARGIAVQIHAERIALPLDAMVQLGIIANELITNSVKYAFEEGKGTITIALHRTDSGVLFAYSDDGIGVEAPSELGGGTSLGIKLIRLAARQLQGSVDMRGADGFVCEIGFKHG